MYNFDVLLERRHTDSTKWDACLLYTSLSDAERGDRKCAYPVSLRDGAYGG